MTYQVKQTDVLVVGAGLAGLRAAREAAAAGARVTVVNKKGICASRDIMGFCAAVGDRDSLELFSADLRRSGSEINDNALIQALVEEAGEQVSFFERQGFTFDRDERGAYHLQSPLGCSVPRLVHQEAMTGSRLMDLLLEECHELGVVFLSPVIILDVYAADGAICGAVGIDLNASEFLVFKTPAVILATGGCGDTQSATTYPKGLAGDGYAIALRAGAELVDMEFQQFEPCCAIYPKTIFGNILCTTMLKLGGKISNQNGEDVLARHGLSFETLQKDTLARAIVDEIAHGAPTPHGGVYFDVRSLPRKSVVIDHNVFYDPIKRGGVDITEELVEVAPMVHTTLGGVKIRPDASTQVDGLFAAGEVSGGIHGANRIGGCAGSETVSFGAISGRSAAKYALSGPKAVLRPMQIQEDLARRTEHLGTESIGNLQDLKEQSLRIADDALGIIRSASSLRTGLDALSKLEDEAASVRVKNLADLARYQELLNRICVLKTQLMSSDLRQESRGALYRSDFPERNDVVWRRNILISLDGDALRLRVSPETVSAQ